MYHVFAQAIGFIAMALNIISYQLKNSRQLVLCRAMGDCIYIIHFLLLGAYSGCTTIAICAVNGLICSFRGSSWADWKGWKWLISVVLVIACLLTWQTDFQPVPCICSMISILANIWTTWSGRSRVMRMGRLFVAGPAWIIYTISAGSIPGILAELIGMSSAAIGLQRYGWRGPESEVETLPCRKK